MPINYELTDRDLTTLYKNLLKKACKILHWCIDLNKEIIRKSIFKYGIPDVSKEEIILLEENHTTTTRGTIWMLLLDINESDPILYFALLKRGRSKHHDLISKVSE